MEAKSRERDSLDALERCFDSLNKVTFQKPICHKIGLRCANLEVVISPGSRRLNYHWSLHENTKEKDKFYAILEATAHDFLGNGHGALKAQVECAVIPEIGPFHYCTTVNDIDVEESLARLLFNVFPTAVDVRFMEISESHTQNPV